MCYLLLDVSVKIFLEENNICGVRTEDPPVPIEAATIQSTEVPDKIEKQTKGQSVSSGAGSSIHPALGHQNTRFLSPGYPKLLPSATDPSKSLRLLALDRELHHRFCWSSRPWDSDRIVALTSLVHKLTDGRE